MRSASITVSAPNRARRLILYLTCLIVSLVLAWGVLALASRIVMPKNNQAEFGQSAPTAYGVLGEPRDSLDVLVLGDSEAYCSFSPLQMWHEQGITSYTCATSGQKLPHTLSLLNRALEQQRPKVVILETNCLFRQFNPSYGAYRAISDIFPVFEYHDRWKHLRPEDFTTSPRTTWTHPNKGFLIKTNVVSADDSTYMQASNKLNPIPSLNRWYVEQIMRTCQDHGAKLVLMSTPSTKNWNMPRHNRVQKLAEELGVDYIDLNVGQHQVKVDWRTDTCDAGDHLNLRGAQKVSKAVGALLHDTYHIPDHRGDTAYQSWNEAYERYARDIAKINWQSA